MLFYSIWKREKEVKGSEGTKKYNGNANNMDYQGFFFFFKLPENVGEKGRIHGQNIIILPIFGMTVVKVVSFFLSIV